MSYLLLHNGNQLVKPWASKFYNCEQMPCLSDPWPNASDLQQKYHLASKVSICTDLTTADNFAVTEIFNAKQSLKVVKVITSYKNDCVNIEPIWNTVYSQQQWLISTFSRLSLADSVVFLQPIALKSLQTEPAIVFTPGRSGTHVLRDITGIQNHLHHNNNFLKSTKFLKVVNSKRVLSVLRRQFVDQVVSDAIGKRYGIILTTDRTINYNQQYVSTWEPFALFESDYNYSLEKICSYVDLLLGIKMFYHKQIEFSLLEDLHDHFDKIDHIKNPYQSQDIISNYSAAIDQCNQKYQPIYNLLIDKLQCSFGINIHHYE
jgi:hypothetical protein